VNGFDENPTLSCSGLPKGATCTFGAPATPADGSVNVNLNLATATLSGDARRTGSGRGSYLLALIPMLLLVTARRRKAFLQKLSIASGLMLVLFAAILAGCGGGTPGVTVRQKATNTCAVY
jgi:hypothetical protein